MVPSKSKRVGIYLRVGTGEQTVDNRRRHLQPVASQRGWQIVAEFVDHGVNGSQDRAKCPAFDRVARTAAAGEVDFNGTWPNDLIGRGLPHLVEFIEHLRPQNVGLYLHQQHVNRSAAAGRAFLQMAGKFVKFERVKTRRTGSSRPGAGIP